MEEKRRFGVKMTKDFLLNCRESLKDPHWNQNWKCSDPDILLRLCSKGKSSKKKKWKINVNVFFTVVNVYQK